jgi:hypothetical protein
MCAWSLACDGGAPRAADTARPAAHTLGNCSGYVQQLLSGYPGSLVMLGRLSRTAGHPAMPGKSLRSHPADPDSPAPAGRSARCLIPGTTARVLRDARDVTSVETTTKPIEVRLSRPHLEVSCRILFPDGTAVAVGVDALSIRGAQHEMTAWLIEQGYEPAGCWSTQDENDRQAARTFRRQDPRSALLGPPSGAALRLRPPPASARF